MEDYYFAKDDYCFIKIEKNIHVIKNFTCCKDSVYC